LLKAERSRTNTLLHYTAVSVLVLGIGIVGGLANIIGYWILDIGCLAWYAGDGVM